MVKAKALALLLAGGLSCAGGTAFKHFEAHNDTQTCTADEHATPFNNQIRGVSLGGWMVLEPWITPSLFYQFLGKDENSTATDIYSFCEVLGPEEGNKQLRRHWDTWLTEEIVVQLKESGAVNSLRLPVGDWMYKPYGPYIGCTDGGLEYVDDLLDWAYENGLNVLMDIHGAKGSQNGFDNSGQSLGFQWTSFLNTVPAGDVTFEHWPIRSAAWIGTFDPVQAVYTDINRDNIQHMLDVIDIVVEKYKDHPAVLGLEPLNEPWQFTPIDELKSFYWEGYLRVKSKAPYWKYIMHDSFRLDPKIWGGFMDGCPDRALDTHIYQAWMDPANRETYYDNACGTKGIIAEMEKAFGPVVVGEWSLATDNCAMWLNGFNDNLPGFPRLPCKYIPCTAPYMGTEQPGTPVDPGKPAQGPYGTGMSTPIFGMCPVGRDWHKNDIQSGREMLELPPKAPAGQDDTDEVMKQLALKKINSFSGYGHGFYFWNFRTDLYEPDWSYMKALERGWIPDGNLKDSAILDACHKEDNGLYLCVAKRDQLTKSVRGGIDYVLKTHGTMDGNKLVFTCDDGLTLDNETVANMTGNDLYSAADCAYSSYWKRNRARGATCDFGGTGTLIEVNRTYTDDDDDSDAVPIDVKGGVAIAESMGLIVLGLLMGSFLGFVLAMRYNKKFNRSVSTTSLGKSMRRNQFLSRSFGGMSSDTYTEIPSRNQVI